MATLSSSSLRKASHYDPKLQHVLEKLSERGNSVALFMKASKTTHPQHLTKAEHSEPAAIRQLDQSFSNFLKISFRIHELMPPHPIPCSLENLRKQPL